LQLSFWSGLVGSTGSPSELAGSAGSHLVFFLSMFFLQPGPVLNPDRPDPGSTYQVKSGFKTMLSPTWLVQPPTCNIHKGEKREIIFKIKKIKTCYFFMPDGSTWLVNIKWIKGREVKLLEFHLWYELPKIKLVLIFKIKGLIVDTN